jgi:hypothetical protein
VKLAASWTTMSFAVFGPIPETRRNGASSSFATASAICATLRADRTPRADLGPTPETLRSSVNVSSSSRPANPNNDSASSRTTRFVCRSVSSPARKPRATSVGTATENPTPPTSTITESASECSTTPRREEIMEPP